MPNRLRISRNGKATQFYRSLNEEERLSLDEALDYIRDVPFPHGNTIVRRSRPPAFIYYFSDEMWRISYHLSLIHPGGTEYDIEILAIARA